ncbi:hypothetical protein M9H77_36822 [Catharanthus roseus]|uniref:Uncharacterized protein n=1 Tax=Catharanthus roseus TaxID=4058 RepID=A0ACB9ZV37_CATRO|nr:hypothetical protein M9H77_36822 [Catharanthus roseus]
MVMEVVQEDMGDGNMQCTDHPYKNSNPGGICAFCLQEKLGKLVSSSFPVAVFPSSSSSSSPSFRSDFGGTTTASTLSVRPNAASSTSSHVVSYNSAKNGDCDYNQYYNRRSKLMFLSTHRRKKKKEAAMAAADATSIVFKRSKSTTTPRRGIHFLDADDGEDFSPHKRGFWSFFYLTSLSKNTTTRKAERGQKDISFSSSVSSGTTTAVGASSSMNGSMRSRERKIEELVVVEENESPDEAAIDRKVSRSRSVGCGSRSFSGDFFERISTGFGDCTLRRVESQREGKPKVHSVHRNSGAGSGQDCIKERVKCGGIFSGFMITSSSSSSSSSSYWVSSSTEDNVNGGKTATTTPASVGHLAHGRSKSWGWAFASPMRAFSKPSNGKREVSNKNATPNLAAIPSLLAVRS